MPFDPTRPVTLDSGYPTPDELDAEVNRTAKANDLDPAMLHSLIHVESGGDPYAVSSAGAAGLTQLLPETAASVGVRDIFDWRDNLRGGARYLRQGMDTYGSPDLAFAYYHGGPNTENWGAHTVDYVGKAMDAYQRRRAASPLLSGKKEGEFDPSKPIIPDFDPSKPITLESMPDEGEPRTHISPTEIPSLLPHDDEEIRPHTGPPTAPKATDEEEKPPPARKGEAPKLITKGPKVTVPSEVPSQTGEMEPPQAPEQPLTPEQQAAADEIRERTGTAAAGRIAGAAREAYEHSYQPFLAPELQKQLETSPSWAARNILAPASKGLGAVAAGAAAATAGLTQAVTEAGAAALGMPNPAKGELGMGAGEYLPGLIGGPEVHLGVPGYGKTLEEARREGIGPPESWVKADPYTPPPGGWITEPPMLGHEPRPPEPPPAAAPAGAPPGGPPPAPPHWLNDLGPEQRERVDRGLGAISQVMPPDAVTKFRDGLANGLTPEQAAKETGFAGMGPVANRLRELAELPTAPPPTTPAEKSPEPTKPPSAPPGQPPAPTEPTEPAGWTEIGKNHIGQTLYEDPNGVRSYIENGVRHTESVGMRPTEQGPVPVIRDPDDKSPEFQVFSWHPSVPRPGPIEWPPVGVVMERHPQVMPQKPGGQMVRTPTGWIVGNNLGINGQPYRPDLNPQPPPTPTPTPPTEEPTPTPTAASWAPEVKLDGKWSRNSLRFPTQEEAAANAADLHSRWMASEGHRAAEAEEEPTHRWIDNRLLDISEAPYTPPPPEPLPPPPPTEPAHRLADRIAEAITYKPQDTPPLAFGNEIQRMAEEEFGGTMASGAYTRDQLYDATELGVNRYIQQHPEWFSPAVDQADAKQAIASLITLKNAMPTQTVRAGEKISFQQFSTPPDYAYAATWLANLRPDDVVLEPSAGTGGLAVHAMNANVPVIANELSDQRAGMLQHLGPTRLFKENAEQLHNILPADVKPSVVVMNPPFSQTAGRMGDKRDLMVGANHIEQAMKRLEPGGRLVAIVGRGMAPDAPTFRDWFAKMGKAYDFRANVGMSGTIYRKYGTNFGTRVLVFDKVAPSGRGPVTGDVETASALIDALARVRDDRPRGTGEQTSGKPGGAPVSPGTRGPGDTQPTVPGGTGPVGPGPGPTGAGPVGGEPTEPGPVGGAGGAPGAGGGAGGNEPGAPVAPGQPQPRPPRAGGRPRPAPGGRPRPAGGGGGGAGGGGGPPVGGEVDRPVAPGNRTRSEEDAKRARDIIRQKLGKGGPPPVDQMAVGPMKRDPELTAAGIDMAVYHIENGARSYPAYAQAMLDDLGEIARPYLRQWYEAARYEPGFDPAGMTPGGEIDNLPEPDANPDVSPDPTTIKTEDAVTDPGNTELTESVYEPYTPQRINIPGAQPHPGPLVQSAAMASVMPPAPRYRPTLPPDVITKGLLSGPQLEAVVYAGEAHSQMLPAAGGETPFRRGFFIGDGTGVGKGREIAGIILDNVQQGRNKAVWISQSKGLIKSAQRDWSGLGQNPKAVFPQHATKASEKIKPTKGVMFTTYDTLRSAERTKLEGETVRGQSRLKQIVDWVGKDFDGVIAFDESHNMQNALDQQQGAGRKKSASQKALAGLELQKQLPNARIVYVSATGATELANYVYANRLGLWGRGTAFPDQRAFLSEMASAGIAGMELVARDMKALGLYMARNLSYDGVEYDRIEHALTPDQRQMYDKMAEAWQVVLQNIDKALEDTGAAQSARAKSAALSQFWSTHQRFFNQVVTSMQMPSVIERADADIANGMQVVLQMVNTNEAAQERALAKVESDEDMEDLDMSPFQQLVDLIEKSFPVQQWEEHTDDNGNVVMRPVTDSEGRPVLNAEAVEARDKLLRQIASLRNDIPDGPLDILLNHFGTDKIAEVTGRKQRVVNRPDEHGIMRKVVEPRGASANQSEIEAFQGAKKKVLVFTNAGSTGESYHASIGTPSADARRSHYLVQPGWVASIAVQGFGRTHRTAQTMPPIFHLVTTDLQGQKRFVSSIARRLAQLGALTKGERRTGDQGMFGLRDNLESEEAKRALNEFISDVYFGTHPGGVHPAGVTPASFEEGMGLKILREDGSMNIPKMTQFLNRILSLKIDQQNAVFGTFAKHLDDVIQRAALEGTLDTGTETYKAERIEKKGDQVVYTDPATGAETRHVHLQVYDRTHPREFLPMVQNGYGLVGRTPQFFVQSARTGKIFAIDETQPRTMSDGKVVPQFRLVGVNDYHYVPQRNILANENRHWTRIDNEQNAQKIWDAEVKATPEFRTSDLHVITGAMLPIWDRLPKGWNTVYRLRTDTGEQMLGRVIPPTQLNEVLTNLGAAGVKITLTPEEIAQRILAGDTAQLANGWKMKPVMVANERRIELTGPGFRHEDQLQQDGVFMETIPGSYRTRYFIPTGDQAPAVIGRIIDGRPVVGLGATAPPAPGQEGEELLQVPPGGGEPPEGGGPPPSGIGGGPPDVEPARVPRPAPGTAPQGTQAPSMAAWTRMIPPQVRLNLVSQGIDYLRKWFAPTHRPGAQPMEYIIRRNNAEMARLIDQGMDALMDYRDIINRLPRAEQLDITDRREAKLPQATPDLQRMMDAGYGWLDDMADLVRSLGRGYLTTAIDGYAPHIWANWKDPGPMTRPTLSDALRQRMARIMGRGAGIRGPGGFRFRRTIPTQREGIDLGYVPVSSNPVDMIMIKGRELIRWYTGTRMADQIKREVGVWVPSGREQALAKQHGLVELEDRVFHPLLPPAVAHHFVAFDPSIRNGILALARALGIDVRTPINDMTLQRLGPDTIGYRRPARGNLPPEIVARFGGNDAVLMHEIGHELDHRFRLSQYFGRNPAAWDELKQLGMLRMPHSVTNANPQLAAYLTAPGERIANLWHAYWHAPWLLNRQAPHAAQMLREFLDRSPNLRALVDRVKPSVQLQTQVVEEFFPGMRDLGAWFAPEAAALVFNRFVSRRDYAGAEALMAWRMSVGAMTSMQLGLSAFHFTFVTNDAYNSRLAMAIEQLAQGRIGALAKSAMIFPFSPVQTLYRGAQFRNAYRNLAGANPPMLQAVDAYIRGGGRYSMDNFYRSSGAGIAAGTFVRSWRHLLDQIRHPLDLPREIGRMFQDTPGWQKLLVPIRVAFRALDTISHPLMAWYVPMMKAGVEYNMIRDWLEAHPNATAREFNATMTDIIDRGDDRLGEMIHDNVFWTRLMKDTFMSVLRAFGWTHGSERTLGGGIIDVPRIVYDRNRGGWGWQGPTRRTSYLLGMLLHHFLVMTMITYMTTGQRPQSWKDLFWAPDGKGGRLSFPDYVKDLWEIYTHPWRWGTNKLAGLLGYFFELVNNEGYYGDTIVGPGEHWPIRWLQHLWEVSKPISIRGFMKLHREHAPIGQQAATFFGIQPAPGYITHPERERAFEQREMKKGMKARGRAQARGLID